MGLEHGQSWSKKSTDGIFEQERGKKGAPRDDGRLCHSIEESDHDLVWGGRGLRMRVGTGLAPFGEGDRRRLDVVHLAVDYKVVCHRKCVE
jgi:hypothetical protein